MSDQPSPFRYPESRLAVLFAVLLALGVTSRLAAQTFEPDAGTPTAAVAGGAIGLLSGTILGTAGSVIPCSQTYAGPRCVRVGAAIGGTVGLVSGLLIGSSQNDEIDTRLIGAGVGLGVGFAASFALRPLIQNFGWEDAAAISLLGAAIGASPRGAVLGLGVGTAVGLVLWQAVPSLKLPDAVATALGGLAVGALTDWTASAINARSDQGRTLAFSMQAPF